MRIAAWGAILVAAASFLVAGANAAVQADIWVQDKNAARPRLIFACDRQTPDLEALITPELISDLKQLNGGIALSTEDLSPARAQIVRKLNAAGIPMTAWIALPKEQGYYVNASNAPQTAQRFADFDKWTTENGLRWEAVGLDIEPTLSEYKSLTDHKGRLLWLALRRAFDSGRVIRARVTYSALIRQIRARGYRVQTYQLAFLADERDAHTTLLERIFGLVDVRGDEEVFMLYSSFNHEIGAATIWQYGPESQVVAVGSTAASGDAAMDARYPPLNWDEFSRDLLVARHFSSTIGIYSLEGCVHQGFMEKLKAMDWTQEVVIPAAAVHKGMQVRHGLHAILWLASHLLYFGVGFLLMFAWLVRVIVRWRRRKRARSI